MRDIADMLMRGLSDPADRDAPDALDDGDRADGWSGRAIRRTPAGDWCQTPPGEEAIGWLAARLSGRGKPGK
ncbi:MAG TPA: hypothetical protein VG164_11335 [Trebonia sp.]|jgi:hypothetical protein|nr:hypothetical protein [Trebonia sp.]